MVFGGSPLRVSLSFLMMVGLLAGCGLQTTPARAPQPDGGVLRARAANAGTFSEGEYKGRRYKFFAPSGVKGKRPLVVMLHGCTQDPDDFARGTGMNELAAKEKFYVLYPEQTYDDQPKACWSFYEPRHQVRGFGEGAAIIGMLDQVQKQHAVDDKAVYLAGLSAGGAYTSMMAVMYPDRFAAVGVHSGLQYGVANNWVTAKMVMKMGGPEPVVTGGLAYLAMGFYKRVMPAMVIHGSADEVVIPKNGEQAARQFVVMNDWASDGLLNGDISTTVAGRRSGQVKNGYGFTRTFYKDKGGRTVVEHVEVEGLGHAWSGGRAGGTYADPKGPDATEMLWRFFKANKRN